jgi:TonB family protein
MLMEFSGHPLVHALGWTLLHFCWQGVVVAGLLWCVLSLLNGRSSQARYGVACFALALLVAMPLITFTHIALAEYARRAELAGRSASIDFEVFLQVDGGGAAAWPVRIAAALDHWVPWLLTAWFAGVVFFVARLNFGLLVARRLKSAGTEAPQDELLQMFDAIKVRLGIRRVVNLLHSASVQVPTVIGWLRPVVLIPASCLTGLSTEQIEAIFCHELAHVRRHDYLVSVFQSVAEALLFYHPAVWWVSKQIRRERECCCDEIAVSNGGDVLAYAKALSYLEERRASFPEFVLGANGGVLTMRIKRLLGCKENAAASQFAAFSLLALVMAVAGSYVVTAARAQSKATQAVVTTGAGQIHAMSLASKVMEPAKVSYEPQSAASASANVSQGDGSIAGIIFDPTGAVVARANVHATNTDTGLKMAQVTDNSGAYLFSSLPPGRYNVAVMAPGFQGLVQDNVRVDSAQKVGLNLKLRVGAVNENLTVAGKLTAASTAPLPPPPPPVASAAGKPIGPVRVSSGVMAGLAISQPQPIYPADAKAARVQGVVVLHAIIAKDGTIANLQVISGPPPLLVSSIDAVRQWKYKPYLLNGEPTEVETTININYTFGESTDSPAQGAAAEYEGAPVRKIGGGVSVPVVIYQVDPEYSAQARDAKFSGIELVNLIVDTAGHPQNVHILRGVGMGLDEKAVEAVKQFRFKPAMEGGTPVPVQLNIEVNFKLDVPATVAPAIVGASVAPLVRIGAAKSVLMARLEPVSFPVSRWFLTGPASMVRAAPAVSASPAARAAAAPQAVPAQSNTPEAKERTDAQHGLTTEQQAQIELEIANAKREAAEASKRLNSPEFRKQIDDAQKQAMAAAQERMNSPEFRKNLEDAQKQAIAAQEHLKSPEFRKQLDDAQRQAFEAMKQLNSPEFKRQIADAKQLARDAGRQDTNGIEFQKAMEEVRKEINAAEDEIRAAGGLVNPPAAK